MIDYATIENGRVTAVTFGASTLPESTTTILYWDVTDLDPQPAVTWFFSEPCNEFSATPPRIPPGEVAPPFQPGGDPPDPDDPLTPEVEEPGPPRIAELAYHLTAFHASGPDTITFGGDDPEQEVTPRWRTTVNFANTCGVRIQAHVVTENDVRLIVKGSIDGGVTWEYLNVEYEGPFLKIVESGEAVGPFVNIDEDFADGDVLVSVFARTGSSTSVTLGNVHLMHAIRVDDAECPIYEIVEECAAPAAMLVDDLSSYASWSAFYAAVNPSAPAFNAGVWSNIGFDATENSPARLDFTNTFNGNPTLAAPLPSLGFFDLSYSRIVDETDPTPGDVTFGCVFSLPADWSPSDPSVITPEYQNFSIFGMLFDGGAGGAGNIMAWGGNVYWCFQEFVVSGIVAPLLLGPVDDWRGGYKQFTMRVTASGGSSIRTRLYLNPACAAPVLLADITNGVTLGADGMYGAMTFNPANGNAGSTGDVRIAQLAMDTDASVFGL
jgi:hypothetical protein